jgi:peptidoglycan/xylan/chitin deacetylase (PgdA/CDA1 family)
MTTVNRLSPARAFKCAVLQVCEAIGLFRLTSAFFAHRLHILCYHGFQLRDECQFRPQLFISPGTFETRLRYIAEQGFVVLHLGEALERLSGGTLPPRALAITIDDGFKSTLSIASPLLRRYNSPATVYVTTYYVDKNAPVFRLAVQYMFWRAAPRTLDSAQLNELTGDTLRPAANDSAHQAMWGLIRHGEALGSEQERQGLLGRLGQLLTLDFDAIRASGVLSLLSPDEVRALAQEGVDIQLHTHRHRFPVDDRASASLEITENQTRLEALAGRPARHFCYPSGVFAPSQWPWLRALGIESATTCIPGLNLPSTPRFGLRRFLDSEDIRPIEFRAELAGFNELARNIRARLRPSPDPTPDTSAVGN